VGFLTCDPFGLLIKVTQRLNADELSGQKSPGRELILHSAKLLTESSFIRSTSQANCHANTTRVTAAIITLNMFGCGGLALRASFQSLVQKHIKENLSRTHIMINNN